MKGSVLCNTGIYATVSIHLSLLQTFIERLIKYKFLKGF